MKTINFVLRFGIVALAMSVASVAFAGNSKYGPLPPPDLEKGPDARLQYGPLPPPDLEKGPDARLQYGPLPPPDLEKGPDAR